MAVKAIVVDDENVQHLIIGLNREDIESLLRGDVFTLPRPRASHDGEQERYRSAVR